MFFEASPDIFRFAHWLRNNMTQAETLLWTELRNNQMGIRFKAQHPMMNYIVDFYSYKLKLVIELDGPIHNFKISYDTERKQNIENAGNSIIRFPNEQVINNLNEVLDTIRFKIVEIQSKQSSSKSVKN